MGLALANFICKGAGRIRARARARTWPWWLSLSISLCLALTYLSVLSTPLADVDQTAEMFATLHKYNTLAAFVGHTHAAALYSHNGTAQGAFDDPRPGFISVVNAPATQKEDGELNPLPSEFMAVEVSVNTTTGTGRFRVAQRVGQTWGDVLGERSFSCSAR